MIVSTDIEKQHIRTAGKILGGILKDLSLLVVEGVSTAELDLAAGRMITERGAVSAFLGYKPEGASYAYPAVLCISLNEEIVHGIPSEKRFLKKGDVVTIDLGLSYKGFFVDAARTLVVGGEPTPEVERLLKATEEALDAAIAAARPHGHVGDIGAAVESIANKHHFSIVEDLGGHAVGAAVHEQPFIPNEGEQGEGEELKPGLVLALEPMLALGSPKITLMADEWTYRTKDRSLSAHFEDTILITETGQEILTRV